MRLTDKLISNEWQYSEGQNTSVSSVIRFEENGTITGASLLNNVYWDVVDGALRFSRRDGQEIMCFDIFAFEHGVTVLRGKCSQDEGECLYELRQQRQTVDILTDSDIRCLNHATMHYDSPLEDRLAMIPMPVGVISGDNVAILGKYGYVFICAGTNREIMQYRSKMDEQMLRLFKQWKAVFVNHHDLLLHLGIPYVQIVIPEKQSILTHAYPLPRETMVTPLLTKLDAFGKNQFVDSYVSVLDLFKKMDKDSIFRKGDSHLLPCSAYMLLCAILDKVRIPFDYRKLSFTTEKVYYPDMSIRFFGIPFYDIVNESEPFDFYQGAQITSRFVPPDNGHVGRRISFRNDSAPIKKKVLVFGNSFFGQGEHQGRLTWWFARFFEEFHFVWSYVIDKNVIDTIEPDLVIWQTIERFLGRTPASQ